MIKNLTLLRRGILLIAFPLLCQLVFVGVLIYLLVSLQQEIDKELHSKFMIEKAEWLARESFQIYGWPLDPRSKADDPDEYNRCLRELMSKFDEVTALVEKERNHEQSVYALRTAANGIRDVTHWMREQRKHGRNHGAIAHQIGDTQVIEVMNNFFNSVSRVVEVEESRREECVKRAHSLLDQLILCLTVAIPSSIVVSAGLGYLYAIGIRRPLGTISTNSRLLSKRQPLLPALKGNDELSELDQLLHQVADSVAEALSKERALVENAADLICSLDEEGVFTSANTFAFRMLGREASQIVGLPLFDFVYYEDISAGEDHLRNARSSKDIVSFDLRLKKSGGSIIDTRWMTFWSEHQKSLFCVVHDVTEQRNIERLKEDFVDMVSHDLRSPLMSIGGTMELVAAGGTGTLTAEIAKEVGNARRNIDRLNNFVNDLLDFQKLKAGKMQVEFSPCDFETIIVESVELIRSVAEAKGVTIAILDGHWTVDCDRPKMVQTVVNMISNAVKFSPKNGLIALSVAEDESNLEFEVSDEGPGVQPEYRELIFQAFEQVPTTSQKKEGTGLGLAICKLLVEAHGGTIAVRDAKNGTGSTFWLRIPLRH